jgi:hypothetical protein
MFNFQPEEFFEAEEEARQDIRVDFGNRGAAAAGASAEPPAGPTA